MKTKWLIDVLKKNELASRSQIDSLKSTLSSPTISNSELNSLVEKNLISRWQCERLKKGKSNFKFGNFRFVERLGVDEYGEVYLAQDSESVQHRVRLVSRKTISLPTERQRFLDRTIAIQNVDDDSLVRITDVFELEDRMFVATALPTGKPLNEWLEMNQITKSQIDSILNSLMRLLSRMKAAGLDHGSIHTQSVFLTDTGCVELDQPSDIGWSSLRSDVIESDTIQLNRLANILLESQSSELETNNQPPDVPEDPQNTNPKNLNHDDIDDVSTGTASSLAIAQEPADCPPIPTTKSLPPTVPPPTIKEVDALANQLENTRETEHLGRATARKKLSKMFIAAVFLTITSTVLCILIAKQLIDAQSNKQVAESSVENSEKDKAVPSKKGETVNKDQDAEENSTLLNPKEQKQELANPKSTPENGRDETEQNAADDQEDNPALPEQKKPEQKKVAGKDEPANTPNSAGPANQPPKNDKPENATKDKSNTTQPLLIIGEKSNKKANDQESNSVPQSPFRDVPAFVELPPPESTAKKELFKIYAPANLPLSVRLHGGYFASPKKFEFTLRQSTSQENTWIVYAGPRDELVQVAQFSVSSQLFCFQWMAKAKELYYANHIKNCGISIKTATSQTEFALRPAEALPALEFTKALNTTTQVKLIDPPNFEHVEVQIIKVPESLKGFAFVGNKKAMAGRADSISLQHKYPNQDAFRVEVSCRYEQQSFKFRAESSLVVPNARALRLTTIKTLEDQAKKTIKDADSIVAQLKAARDNGNKIPDEALRRQFFESARFKQLQSQAQIAPDLKNRAAKYLAVGKRLDQSRIGLRVIYKAGEMEIELAKSKFASPPAKPKTNKPGAKKQQGKK